MIQFQMKLDGSYTLSSSYPPWSDEVRYDGQMDDTQRDAVLNSIQTNQLLEIPSSTRIAREDEIPIVVELTYQDLSHRLLVWELDEPQNTNISNFEAGLQAIFDELSQGAIMIEEI